MRRARSSFLPFYTNCSSFVEEKATACHSEPFAVILIPQSREKDLALPAQGKLREESPHLKAQSVRKNAEILLPQGGIRMTDNEVILYE